MIKTDGYYISHGIHYVERSNQNSPWFLFLAYWFKSDGTFIKAAKYSNNLDFVEFNVSDFLLENSNKFEILNDHIKLYFYEGLPWAFKEKLEKVSFNVFILESGMQIEFKSW